MYTNRVSGYSQHLSGSSTSSSAAAVLGSSPNSKLHSSGGGTGGAVACGTLPITCQICLGKVKEPCVCPNMHVFCSFCIAIWLEKTKQCPTCRVAISKEAPCRRILGGAENFDEVDRLKPSDFSHASIRQARHLSLHQQYEDEIERLNRYIDSLNDDIKKLKDAPFGNKTSGGGSQSSPQQDMMQMLKQKLHTTQNLLDDAMRDRDKYREANMRLESENSILLQDVMRLKASLNERNTQTASKYAVAALETKVETYEKEIKQLQKALEKSDKHTADLESRLSAAASIGRTLSSNVSSCNSNTESAGSCSDYTSSSPPQQHQRSPPSLKFSKGDNHSFKSDLKMVKFADKVHTIPTPSASASSTHAGGFMSPPPVPMSLSSSSSSVSINSNSKQSVISNDKFYGSPSKAASSSAASVSGSGGPSVMSFSDRMRKLTTQLNGAGAGASVASAFELDAGAVSGNFAATSSQSILLSESAHGPSATGSTGQQVGGGHQHQQFLFSPMKRLRLADEFSLEKPSSFETTTTGAATHQQRPHNQSQNEFASASCGQRSELINSLKSNSVESYASASSGECHESTRRVTFKSPTAMSKCGGGGATDLAAAHHQHQVTPYNHAYHKPTSRLVNKTSTHATNNNNNNNSSTSSSNSSCNSVLMTRCSGSGVGDGDGDVDSSGNMSFEERDVEQQVRSKQFDYQASPTNGPATVPMNGAASEFNDCIELLTRAEQKVLQQQHMHAAARSEFDSPPRSTMSSSSSSSSSCSAATNGGDKFFRLMEPTDDESTITDNSLLSSSSSSSTTHCAAPIVASQTHSSAIGSSLLSSSSSPPSALTEIICSSNGSSESSAGGSRYSAAYEQQNIDPSMRRPIASATTRLFREDYPIISSIVPESQHDDDATIRLSSAAKYNQNENGHQQQHQQPNLSDLTSRRRSLDTLNSK